MSGNVLMIVVLFVLMFVTVTFASEIFRSRNNNFAPTNDTIVIRLNEPVSPGRNNDNGDTSNGNSNNGTFAATTTTVPKTTIARTSTPITQPTVRTNVSTTKSTATLPKLDEINNYIDDDDDNDDDDNDRKIRKIENIGELTKRLATLDRLTTTTTKTVKPSLNYLLTLKRLDELAPRVKLKRRHDINALIELWESIGANDTTNRYKFVELNALRGESDVTTRRWVVDGLCGTNDESIKRLVVRLCQQITYRYVKFTSRTTNNDDDNDEQKRLTQLSELLLRFYQLYSLLLLHERLANTINEKPIAAEWIRLAFAFVYHATMLALPDYRYKLGTLINAAVILNRDNRNTLMWLKRYVVEPLLNNDECDATLLAGKQLARVALRENSPRALLGRIERSDKDGSLTYLRFPDRNKRTHLNAWFSVNVFRHRNEQTLTIFQVNTNGCPFPHVKRCNNGGGGGSGGDSDNGDRRCCWWWLQQGEMYANNVPATANKDSRTLFDETTTADKLSISSTDEIQVCRGYELKTNDSYRSLLRGVSTHQSFTDKIAGREYARNIYSFLPVDSDSFGVTIDGQWCGRDNDNDESGDNGPNATIDRVDVYNVHRLNHVNEAYLKNDAQIGKLTTAATTATTSSYQEISRYVKLSNDGKCENVTFVLPIESHERTTTYALYGREQFYVRVETDRVGDSIAGRDANVCLRIDRHGNVQLMVRHGTISKRVRVICTMRDDATGKLLNAMDKLRFQRSTTTTKENDDYAKRYDETMNRNCASFVA